MVDLNSLVNPPSDTQLLEPSYINDRGEITGNAMLPNGDVHAVVLIPDGDCDSSCESRSAATQANPTVAPRPRAARLSPAQRLRAMTRQASIFPASKHRRTEASRYDSLGHDLRKGQQPPAARRKSCDCASAAFRLSSPWTNHQAPFTSRTMTTAPSRSFGAQLDLNPNHEEAASARVIDSKRPRQPCRGAKESSWPAQYP